MPRRGSLSSINLIAGASILGNVGGTGLAANTTLVADVASYNSLAVVSQFASVISGAAGNIANVSGATLTSLKNLAGDIFPAVTNAMPSAYIPSLGNTPTGGFSGVVSTQANNIMGNGDLGIFSQVLTASNGFVSTTNQAIRSAKNAESVGYTSQDNTITGGFSDVSLAFSALGYDMSKLGILIDLGNLDNLGDPAALLRQIDSVSFGLPGLSAALINSGIPEEIASDLSSPEFSGALEKLAYQAMLTVTGNDLAQILKLLKVTTPNINTLADLLNPFKLFPNSFQTLTAPTRNGLRGVYVDSSGAVNNKLATELPSSVLAPLQGNPLQSIPR